MTYKISLSTLNQIKGGDFFGYGIAYTNIRDALGSIEINGKPLVILDDSSEAKIQINIGGSDSQFHKGQYKIHMAQWESTVAPDAWVEEAKGYDEFWTANYFGADALINSGIPKEKVFVYEHGIDADVWTKSLRGQKDKIRFLHIDSGNQRKRADVVIEAFKNTFGNDPRFELTLKYSYKDVYSDAKFKRSKADWSVEQVLTGHGQWDGNIRSIYEIMDTKDLVNLYHYHDILVYPSEGEGFGFIPLQAVITGMPTISTGVWCSYEKYFNGNVIDSEMGQSTFIRHHFRGNSVIPNVESTAKIMRYVADNIQDQAKLFYSRADEAAAEYTWEAKTVPIISALIKRVGEDKFL